MAIHSNHGWRLSATLGRTNNTAKEVCKGIDTFFQHEPMWVVHFHIKVTSQDLVFQEA